MSEGFKSNLAVSIVRNNLMTQPGYTPYCGAPNCRFQWPRTTFNGEQFVCGCGWQSGFEKDFIDRLKEIRRASGQT